MYGPGHFYLSPRKCTLLLQCLLGLALLLILHPSSSSPIPSLNTILMAYRKHSKATLWTLSCCMGHFPHVLTHVCIMCLYISRAASGLIPQAICLTFIQTNSSLLSLHHFLLICLMIYLVAWIVWSNTKQLKSLVHLTLALVRAERPTRALTLPIAGCKKGSQDLIPFGF